MTKTLLWLAFLGCLVGVQGKGSAGYRSWKGGSYSRSRMYGVGGIYLWSRGYPGSRGNSRGATTSMSDLGINEDDVFCRREVKLDHPSYVDPNVVTLNSTRFCYKEVTTTYGSPYNPVVNNTWMDVYQWQLQAGNGVLPTITMTQYDDKDYSAPNGASFLRVAITSLKERHTAYEVDPRTLTWAAARSAPADKPVFGYPASYFKDEAQLTTFSIRGESAARDVDITLTFTVASDFAEDAYDDYTFMRPSGMKVDVTVARWPFTSVHGDIGVEFALASAKATHSVGMPTPSKYGTEYDPRAMNRVEVGRPTDTETRGRHFFSWESTTNRRALCTSPNGAHCATPAIQSCGQVLCQICATTSDSATELCRHLATPQHGRASRLLIWANSSGSEGLYNESYSNHVKTNYVTWSFYVGTWDYAEQVAPSSAAVSLPSWSLLALSALAALIR